MARGGPRYSSDMALLDRLAERVFDEVTDAHRDSVGRRRALRDEAVAQLVAYSQAIETMRMSLLRTRDSLNAGGPISPDDLTVASEELLHGPHAPEAPIMARVDRLGIDPEALHRVEGQLVDQAVSNLFGEGLRHHRSHHKRLREQSAAARKQAMLLDEAWARVRPILDDALELEAVAYLRECRHELRALIDQTFRILAVHSTSRNMATDRDRRRAIDAVDRLLLVADAWNSHVAGTRQRLRDRRR